MRNLATLPISRRLIVAAFLHGAALLPAAALEILSLEGDNAQASPTLTYEGYSLPSINDNGDVAFAANLVERDESADDSFEGIALRRNGSTSLISYTGASAAKPGTNGSFESFSRPTLLEEGRVVFRGLMQDSQDQLNRRGIWAADVTASETTMHLLARGAELASIDYSGGEDEGRYEYFSHPIAANPSDFAFIADLYSGDYDEASGAWLQQADTMPPNAIPDASLIAVTGAALPNSALILSEALAVIPSTEGNAILSARLEEGDGVDTTNHLGLWNWSNSGTATLIARSGDSSPDSADAFASFGRPAADGDGNAYFWADLVNEAQTEGIFSNAGSEGLQSLLETGQDVLIDGETLNFSSLYDPAVNTDGDLAALGVLQGNAGQAIVKRSDQGHWSIVAKSGQQAPGSLAGTLLGELSNPLINADGQIAFSARLEADDDQVSDTTDFAVFASDGNGNNALAVRKGDTIEASPGSFKTIAAIAIGGFNAEGTLALKLSFADELEAIATVSIESALPPEILSQPNALEQFEGASLVLSVEATGQAPLSYEWRKDGQLVANTSEPSLSIDPLGSDDAGNYTVTVSNPVGQVTSQPIVVTVNDPPAVPYFIEHPESTTVPTGSSASITAEAISSLPISYQWYWNGIPIPGATASTYYISNADSNDQGVYFARATTSAGSSDSASANIAVGSQRLVNVSTRAKVGTGANVLIAGFVVDGSEQKTLLVRGVGPTLEQYGVEGSLQQPVIQIKDQSENLLHENTGWSQLPNKTEIIAAASQVGAFELSTDSDDAALLITVNPGVYTVTLSGENNATGVGLVEVYEVGEGLSKLLNISSRGFVGIGSEVIIPGIVIGGQGTTKLVIRAVGPTLSQFDVAGVLEFPILEVETPQGEVLATNERWQDYEDVEALEAAFALVGAFELLEGSEDAALLIELPPGAYGIRVRGADGTIGVALVEAYEVIE